MTAPVRVIGSYIQPVVDVAGQDAQTFAFGSYKDLGPRRAS
jgi:hypothetical protein